MNFLKNAIFKGVAQGLLDSALPVIKAELIARLTTTLLKIRQVPADLQPVIVAGLTDAINNWTIKL